MRLVERRFQLIETGIELYKRKYIASIYISFNNKVPILYYCTKYAVEPAVSDWEEDYQDPTNISSIYDLRFV